MPRVADEANHYVYEAFDDQDKSILFRSRAHHYRYGQQYSVCSLSCPTSEFFLLPTNAYDCEDLGKCFWRHPDMPIDRVSPEDQALIKSAREFNVESWNDPAIISYAYPVKRETQLSDVYVAFRGDRHYATFRVPAHYNYAFYKGKSAMYCLYCRSASCYGGCRASYDQFDENYEYFFVYQ